jgi:hypothetical protein
LADRLREFGREVLLDFPCVGDRRINFPVLVHHPQAHHENGRHGGHDNQADGH